jgi:hypothetical protein
MFQKNQDQPTNGEKININTPLELLAFKIPRKSFALVLLALGGTIGSIGLTTISLLFLKETSQISFLVQAIQIILSILFLIISIVIYQNSIKRTDKIVIRKHRGGVMTFDKEPLQKQLYFDKKDPTTEVTVIWNGTAMDKQSGVRIVQISEGSKTNENINLSVPESDWAKNLASMVRLKTFADQAEDELFNNQVMFGLKWQDIAIILIVLLAVGIVIILLGVTPDMVSKAVSKSLFDGTLQNAVKSVMMPVATGGA